MRVEQMPSIAAGSGVGGFRPAAAMLGDPRRQHGDDQQAHLEAPVAEVGVAQHLVAAEPVEPLDGLADDRGAQVADVHLLGDVGAAVVDDAPGAAAGTWRRADARVGGDLARRAGQRLLRATRRLMKPGPATSALGDAADRRPGALRHRLGDLARVAPLPALAAARAPLHWKSARSGRSEASPGRSSPGKPSAGEGGAGRLAEADPQIASSVGGGALHARRGGFGLAGVGRKRLPWRLKSAICGVTSKPSQDLEVGAADLESARGMAMLGMVSVTVDPVLAGREGHRQVEISLSSTAWLRSVTATQ